MTVKLLSVWGDQPPGTLYTSTAATETAMIAAGVATATLTGGVAWIPNGGSPGSTPQYLGRRTAAEIAAINAAILAGTVGYASGSTVLNADTGALWRLSGLGTAAAFAVDGGGSSSSLGQLKTTGVYSIKQEAGAGATALSAGYTSIEQKPLDIYPFFGIRVMFINNGASPYTVDLAKVASAPTDLHNGVGLTYLPITVGGSASFTVPAMTQGAGGTAGNNRIAGVVWSDFIPLASVARTDFPAEPFLIQVRAYGAGVLNVFGSGVTRANGSTPYLLDRGYKFGWIQAAGDTVTTPTAATLGVSSGLGVVGHVEVYTGKPHFSFYAFGDSLTAGYSGTADGSQCGWVNMLGYRMRTTGLIGGIANYAVGGMLQANYLQIMKAVCAANPPSAAYISAFSPNSASSTQAGWDGQYAATLEAVMWLKARGIEPIVSNAMPLNGHTSQQKAWRVAFNARLAADLAKVCRVWDFSTVVEDPAVPGSVLPAYDYDTIHQSPPGQLAISNYAALQLGL